MPAMCKVLGIQWWRTQIWSLSSCETWAAFSIPAAARRLPKFHMKKGTRKAHDFLSFLKLAPWVDESGG